MPAVELNGQSYKLLDAPGLDAPTSHNLAQPALDRALNNSISGQPAFDETKRSDSVCWTGNTSNLLQQRMCLRPAYAIHNSPDACLGHKGTTNFSSTPSKYFCILSFFSQSTTAPHNTSTERIRYGTEYTTMMFSHDNDAFRPQ